MRASQLRQGATALVLALAAGVGAAQPGDPCAIAALRRSDLQGLRVDAPDGQRFLVNREDDKGIAQVYVGASDAALVCITCVQRSGGPRADRFKMQPKWHPSGRWIVMAVERDSYSTPPVLGWSRKIVEGMLQSGLWTDMWAVTPDGERWVRLTEFKSNVRGVADGFTGPAFTPDGRRAVWSQIVDGNILRYYPFGRWELVIAEVEDGADGMPRLVDRRDITPAGMHWNEPGNFHPDGRRLLFSGPTEKDAQGMDQYLLDVVSGELTNLTRSPTVWDEHGLFSPNGAKIIFMSAWPYRDDPGASKVVSIKTEFMMMNAEGSGIVRITHFAEPGWPEHSPQQRGTAANPAWSADGRSARLLALVFPKYEYWEVEFAGACGR